VGLGGLSSCLHAYPVMPKPEMNNRDAFCLFYDAKSKEVKGLNGSGRAPARLSIEYILSRGIRGRIPSTDINAVTVPGSNLIYSKCCPDSMLIKSNLGAAAAWIDTVEKFGSGNVTLAEIFEPAIRLAEEGWVCNEYYSLLGQLNTNVYQGSRF
jgi:gamma-glutamyltranspeptidase/glutathione hydrolase